jgi:hypothetical protein
MDSTYQARSTRMAGSNDLKLPNGQNAVPGVAHVCYVSIGDYANRISMDYSELRKWPWSLNFVSNALEPSSRRIDLLFTEMMPDKLKVKLKTRKRI